MYVGYLVDKEGSMYHQGAVRRSGISLPPQNFVSTSQYSDFTGYHHVPNMDTHAQSSGAWGAPYGAPRRTGAHTASDLQTPFLHLWAVHPRDKFPTARLITMPCTARDQQCCLHHLKTFLWPNSPLREKGVIPISGWAKPSSRHQPVRANKCLSNKNVKKKKK